MYPVQLYCTMVDHSVDADASIRMTSAPVFERENVRELAVETVDEECLDVEDDDDVTVVTMFPDPDCVDRSDDDTIDYPSSEEEDTDDGEDDESVYDDDDFEDAHLWSTLTDSVRYDLEHPPEEDEFYDAVEVEEVPTVHKGIEYFDAIAPQICSYVWFRPRPSTWWHNWMQVAKITAFWASTLFWDTMIHFVTAPPTFATPRSPSSLLDHCPWLSQDLDVADELPDGRNGCIPWSCTAISTSQSCLNDPARSQSQRGLL